MQDLACRPLHIPEQLRLVHVVYHKPVRYIELRDRTIVPQVKRILYRRRIIHDDVKHIGSVVDRL